MVNSIERPSRALPSDRTFQPSSFRTLFRTSHNFNLHESVRTERERERGSGATADFPPLLPPSPVLHRFHDVALTLFPYRESLLEGKDSPPWGIVIDLSPPKRFHSFSTPLLFLLIQHWNISIGRSRLLRILALTRILVKGVPSIAFQLHEGIA